ncbi:MAG: imidazole glycerol phosphate synthase subunit HisH [Opitutales bacterium]|nr:imidazole glycerol phosphate synthase subunit HisH [Opitutales bacterium]
MKTVALIDYGMGNLRSVARALEKIGAQVRIVSQPDEVADAKALIFPGQGAIGDAKDALAKTGFDNFIKNWVDKDRPFMGICLGLQILFEHSEEGDVRGLGIFKGNVLRFPSGTQDKIPHMGWNTVEIVPGNEGNLSSGISSNGESFYFVHSYYVSTTQEEIVWSKTHYAGIDFVSAIRRGNLFAVQFHPEKSQKKGLQIYKNFLNSF